MDRRPRLADVAARAGVSTASVSLVLRGEPGPSAETRERVLEAAGQLGYRADRTASLLARRRRHLLGVLLDVRNPFHAELVEEIHVEADQAGYEVVLSTLTRGRDEHRAIETLLDFRCEALLLLGPDSSEEALDRLAAQVPVVVVGRAVGKAQVDAIRPADDAGVDAALLHLIGLGHLRIAFVDGGQGAVAAVRRRGYRRAIRRAGLVASIVAGGRTEEAGVRAGRRLLASQELPTAVVASNDRLAVGLMDAFLRAGVDVPGRVSVVGYDDSILARLAHIDLTSVNQDAPAQARNAVLAAVSRLDEGRTIRYEAVQVPHLVVRGSTAAPFSS
ncbi:LacI family DNA-binding transcriptional regulator [Paractinoplanes ferrugineus]|uniref:LacI family transcriptional regulator n=1 Tax=Paractinoplanes ferrugineus TaxID=113564 RepID=A0A919J866_9ACTN|nr:LacI family DNA-binding transcriptional regulator [Actinoplanes ferrugineus]GIE15359.1 LacI family transcriptional regulator [Actinoplanes ferrugineus]